MKTLRQTLLLLLIVVLAFSCEPACSCDPVVKSPLKGDWQLTRITYGLTQKTVTAAEAGYTETLSFTSYESRGTYRQTRNGLPINSGNYSLLFPNGGNTEGRVLYQMSNQQETFEQSFKLEENNRRLIMTERKPLTVAIADGSTYEYRRQ